MDLYQFDEAGGILGYMDKSWQWVKKGRTAVLVKKGQPCSNCKSLKSGMRSRQDPHEYLLRVGPVESNAAANLYRCLICRTSLTCDQSGPIPRWT